MFQTMNEHTTKLAKEFKPSGEAEWRTLAETALRGADFETALIKHTEDGLELGPLFTENTSRETAHICKSNVPFLAGRPWHITPRIDHPDIKQANTDALDDLNGGASALNLKIDPSGANGVALQHLSDIQRLLSGVHTDLVPINLAPSEHNFETAILFCAHSEPETSHLSLGYAPIAPNVEKMTSLAKWVHDHAPHWKALSVNAALTHEAGATPAQELGFMAFQTASYLRVLIQNGFAVEDACALIDVHLASDQDGHQGIIKFRAAHALWAKIVESFGANNTRCTLHVHTSERMLSKADPWANLLRINAASFAAVCGGADYITTLPFTQPLGLATSFARRIARNIQLLQMEESHLGHVQDPAHGSFMHEALTQTLCAKSWEIFQHMESLGDIEAAHNWLKIQIDAAHALRTQKLQDGDILLVGINQFTKSDIRKAKTLPRPNNKPVSSDVINTTNITQAIDQAKAGKSIPAHNNISAFPPVRVAEGFEA
ncbi:MAG: hypothetical protein COA69_00230 [Robiginitomaculum sp.]|nr:MAG: hypothetical protein COA69_00230 [Robiginitomaculum sp.]